MGKIFLFVSGMQYKVFDMILSKIIMVVFTDVILVSEKTDKALFDMTPLGFLFLCVPLINKKFLENLPMNILIKFGCN